MKNRGHSASLQQGGYVLFTVVVMLVVVATVALLVSYDSSLKASVPAGEAEASRADYVAKAAMQHALWKSANNSCMGDVTIPATTLGDDSYAATVTGAAAGTSFVLTPDQDTWIRDDDVTQTNGGNSKLHIAFESGNTEHVLMRFDLTALPAGAPLNSALAWIYVDTGGPGGGSHPEGPLTVHQVTADWTEAGATWETMGGKFEKSALATISAQPTAGVWVSFNLTGQVQAWVNGQPNFGILFASSAEGVHANYSSREDGSNSPRLEVVVGSGPASPVIITATGTLNNGNVRTLARPDTKALQPATTIVFQPGPVDGVDAEIWEQGPNNNYGDAAETWVSSASNDTTRSLLRFNMGAIPAGARILEATLSLQQNSGAGADHPVSAHRIMNPWSEASVTWNDRQPGTNWDTAGGDFDAMAVATTPIGPVTQRYEWNIAPLVQGWVDGSYPNYGVALVAAIAGMPGERFYTSDESTLDRRPSLTITYACECGSACMAPQGSGKVLLVSDWPGVSVEDMKKEALFETWGYTVDQADDHFLWLVNFNNYDVVYVSETVVSTAVNTQLTNLSIGVVNEEGNLNDELGMASATANPVGASINVTDTSHYITLPFPAGELEIYSADMEGLTVSGTEAPGLQTLADWGGIGSLVVLDEGMPNTSGGTAAGRRVMLPLGRSTDSNFNWDHLNANGRLIVQRAIAWGMGANAVSAGSLLMVVVNPSSLTTQEQTKKTLIESWAYAVNLIDESASQGDFDAALAANEVVFVTEDTNATTVGTKLTAATIGVVTEEDNLADELGFSTNIDWGSGTDLKIDNTHYITETLPEGSQSVLTALESLAYLTPALSPDLRLLGQSPDGIALASLNTGAQMHNGGNALGRRVILPWGGSNMDVNHLTAAGLTIFRRALEWGAGVGGLVAHWKLDETSGTTAVDSVGGNDGTLFNGPSWVTGWLDGGLSFDGANDYVDVSSMNPMSYDDFTISAWYKSADMSVSDDEYIYVHDDSFVDELTFGPTDDVSDRLRLGINRGGSWDPHYGTSDIVDQEWHHLVAVRSGGRIKLYVDNVEESDELDANAGLTVTISGDGPFIGDYPGVTEQVHGILDDVRLYDVALSALEISDLFTAPGGGGGGGGGGTFRDEFNAIDYSGSDGTLVWATDWLEIGESDGPNNGKVRLRNDISNFQLELKNKNRGVERGADLSGYASATLTFQYRRDSLDNSDDYVVVEVSSNGGSTWTEIDRLVGPATDSSYTGASYDISAHIAANMRIRFLTSGSNGKNDFFYFDNVEIAAN